MKISFDAPVFFLATDRPEESRKFYAEVLALEIVADEPFALVFRVGERMLRIQKMDRFEAAPQTVMGWEVEDIEAVVDELRGRGVVFERFPGIEQDDRGVWLSPGGAKVGWFRDPCGNLLSLTQLPIRKP